MIATTSTIATATVISTIVAVIPPIIGPMLELVVELSVELPVNDGVGEVSFKDGVGEILMEHSPVTKTVEGTCIDCGFSTVETDICIYILVSILGESLTYLQVYEWLFP